MQNAVLKFRMSGLVTFKLFANTYVTNVRILYALFSIVGLEAIIFIEFQTRRFSIFYTYGSPPVVLFLVKRE